MNQGAETAHVVFGFSIANLLREVLPSLGGTGHVTGFANGLSVGPIDPPDPAWPDRLALDRAD